MDRDEVLSQYETTGREQVFLEAKKLYEQALAGSPEDAELHLTYGYLLECHARNELRQAVAQYERAIELDPNGNKAHYQRIGARAGLLEPEIPIAIYERRFESSPHDLDSHRLLATAYLAGVRRAAHERSESGSRCSGPPRVSDSAGAAEARHRWWTGPGASRCGPCFQRRRAARRPPPWGAGHVGNGSAATIDRLDPPDRAA
jgi:tetratricopeptide (TPR) repeat protein